ncbi:odorant receptor Or2-like [Bacillus rossius redtenbacheri]|uniref:odorant receptor Or2-like n=1 Tax=Bacillus rossius redtenbacheri TaxID=93214 RepID=UPI002FDD0526
MPPLIDVRTNTRLLRALGLLGPSREGGVEERAGCRALHALLTSLVLAAYALAVVPACAALLRDCRDLDAAVDNACLTLPLFFSGVRCVHFVRRRPAMEALFRDLLAFEDLDCSGAVVAERSAILKGASRRARNLTAFFNCLGVLMLATITASPAVAGARASRRLPVAAEYLVLDALASPCYEAAYALQVHVSRARGTSTRTKELLPRKIPGKQGRNNRAACLFLVIFNVIAFDMACMALVMHARAQFDVLAVTLRDLGARATKEQAGGGGPFSPGLCRRMHQGLVRCIEHHKDVIRFVEKLDTAYHPIMLGLIVYSMTMIAITSFKATESSAEVGDLLKFAALSSTCIFELYFFCRLCDDILQGSQAVAAAACCCDWYDTDAEFKDTLKMLILRANKPVRLSAGRFRTMSLETFAALLNSSYSLFAMLKQLNH